MQTGSFLLQLKEGTTSQTMNITSSKEPGGQTARSEVLEKKQENIIFGCDMQKTKDCRMIKRWRNGVQFIRRIRKAVDTYG